MGSRTGCSQRCRSTTHLVLPQVGQRRPPQRKLKHRGIAASGFQTPNEVVRARLVPEAAAVPNCIAGPVLCIEASLCCCRLTAQNNVRVGALESKPADARMHTTSVCRQQTRGRLASGREAAASASTAAAGQSAVNIRIEAAQVHDGIPCVLLQPPSRTQHA